MQGIRKDEDIVQTQKAKVNCGHYPMVFIPNFSTLKGEPQDPDENAKTYAESQQQRALERNLREQKRDLEVMKAQGASAEEINAQKERVRSASADIDEFCDKTGRARKRSREQAPVRAEWNTDNGKITRYNSGYIGTKDVPPPKGKVQTIPQIESVPQITSVETPKVQSNLVTNILPKYNIAQVPLTEWESPPRTMDIVRSLGGGDKTSGSCASLSFAYTGNKAGYQVHDFRGGESCEFFSRSSHIKEIGQFNGVVSFHIEAVDDFKAVQDLLQNVVEGKEYILATGQHTAIVRKLGDGYEYLELQSERYNGFHTLTNSALRDRFRCKHSRSVAGFKLEAKNDLIEVESLSKSPDFIEMLKYINTEVGSEMKGAGGFAK